MRIHSAINHSFSLNESAFNVLCAFYTHNLSNSLHMLTHYHKMHWQIRTQATLQAIAFDQMYRDFHAQWTHSSRPMLNLGVVVDRRAA